MAVSVGFVLTLNVYCFSRVLRAPSAKKRLHAPLDIETGEKLD
jgi:hypothetical protein